MSKELSRARRAGYDARRSFERKFGREYKMNAAWLIVFGMLLGALIVFSVTLLVQ